MSIVICEWSATNVQFVMKRAQGADHYVELNAHRKSIFAMQQYRYLYWVSSL